MSKNQQQIEKELADEQAVAAAATSTQDPVNNSAPEVKTAQEPQEAPKATGIPSADDIRSLRHIEPSNSIDPWMDATRGLLGNYLLEHAELLNDGTELEFAYPVTNTNDVALWAQHYIKFQGELQSSGYRVYMIGQAGNPHLRIKLDAPRKVVAE